MSVIGDAISAGGNEKGEIVLACNGRYYNGTSWGSISGDMGNAWNGDYFEAVNAWTNTMVFRCKRAGKYLIRWAAKGSYTSSGAASNGGISINRNDPSSEQFPFFQYLYQANLVNDWRTAANHGSVVADLVVGDTLRFQTKNFTSGGYNAVAIAIMTM